jgi:signal transduction histidine kinase
MKLANHYNKASIIISVSVLFISAIVYYSIINHIARKELDEDLSEEIGEFIDYVNTYKALPTTAYDQNETRFVKTNLSSFTTRFFDSSFTNDKDKTVEGGRAVSALVAVKGENYIVTITESREETEHLISIISAITILLTAILLFVLIITNTYVLNGLWRPFYHLLAGVKNFNVADNHKINIVSSKVDEFSELSDAVYKMSARVSTDYQGLKTFTENASHEMMTPLAVITSKLDMLIQDEGLNSDQLTQITGIYSAANKLSRLNQSLLLLVKIDNNLIPETELLDMSDIVAEKARQFQELIQNKKIELEIQLEPLKISASRYLMDVLANNLFSNAIRHNTINGKIIIKITDGKLFFQNTSEQSRLNADTVFERFYKGKTSEGTGLGLAIMKNICSQYRFDVQYSYINHLHMFEIDFKKNGKQL